MVECTVFKSADILASYHSAWRFTFQSSPVTLADRVYTLYKSNRISKAIKGMVVDTIASCILKKTLNIDVLWKLHLLNHILQRQETRNRWYYKMGKHHIGNVFSFFLADLKVFKVFSPFCTQKTKKVPLLSN